MLFCKVRQNLKTRRMPVMKIVMAIVLFVALSDKMLYHNFISTFQGGSPNFLSIEKFVQDIINICRIITTSFSITISVGTIFLQIATMMVVAHALFFAVKSIIKTGLLAERSSEYHNVHVVAYATNDIYLQTNKFIC